MSKVGIHTIAAIPKQDYHYSLVEFLSENLHLQYESIIMDCGYWYKVKFVKKDYVKFQNELDNILKERL